MTFDHLKPRYSFSKVCEIFEIHESTLRRWMKEGVPLADGRKTLMQFIPLGPRKTVFEKDEIERVYREMREASGEEGADVIPFPDEAHGVCSRCRSLRDTRTRPSQRAS